MLYGLIFIAVVLTLAMFITRNSMLGFPSALFWAILGGHAYTLSTTPWGDTYFYLAMASLLGMVAFTALGAWGLRERRDTYAEQEMEKGEDGYIDEGRSSKRKMLTSGRGQNSNGGYYIDESGSAETSPRVHAIRARAARRRAGFFSRRTGWGEFK